MYSFNFSQFSFFCQNKNCESECETDIMYKECHCILYYMPRSHSNITICGQKEEECVVRVDRELQLRRNSTYKCSHCFSGCFALTYENSFSTAKIFEGDDILRKQKLKPKNVAYVHIYYAKSSFRSQRIEELVGFADFLCRICFHQYFYCFSFD